jgi:hypothetical protein
MERRSFLIEAEVIGKGRFPRLPMCMCKCKETHIPERRMTVTKQIQWHDQFYCHLPFKKGIRTDISFSVSSKADFASCAGTRAMHRNNVRSLARA